MRSCCQSNKQVFRPTFLQSSMLCHHKKQISECISFVYVHLMQSLNTDHDYYNYFTKYLKIQLLKFGKIFHTCNKREKSNLQKKKDKNKEKIFATPTAGFEPPTVGQSLVRSYRFNLCTHQDTEHIFRILIRHTINPVNPKEKY